MASSTAQGGLIRAGGIDWTPEMQDAFRLQHPEAANADLAQQYGVNVAAIERVAFLLCSKKSKAFKAARRPATTKTVTPITYAPGTLPWRAQAMQTTWTPPLMTYRGQATRQERT